HKEIVKLLLNHPRIDVNVKDNTRGATALSYAVMDNQPEIVKILCEKRNAKGQRIVDVNTKGNGDTTPLILAVNYGFTKFVRIFVVNGADINAKDEEGGTPIQFATMEGHKDIIK
ncbi:ankyrin, partial [Anaeromyces robustus]